MKKNNPLVFLFRNNFWVPKWGFSVKKAFLLITLSLYRNIGKNHKSTTTAAALHIDNEEIKKFNLNIDFTEKFLGQFRFEKVSN